MSKSLRITAGPCPGRAQRAIGEPGRVAEIHTITLEKMAGRHLHIFCHAPLVLLSRFHPPFLYRLQDHRRSVAILPSALLLSMICSVPVGRFSFQWVLPPVSRSLGFRVSGPGAGLMPQS